MPVEGPVFVAPEGGDVAVKAGPAHAGGDVSLGVQGAAVFVAGLDDLVENASGARSRTRPVPLVSAPVSPSRT